MLLLSVDFVVIVVVFVVIVLLLLLLLLLSLMLYAMVLSELSCWYQHCTCRTGNGASVVNVQLFEGCRHIVSAGVKHTHVHSDTVDRGSTGGKKKT